MYIYHLGCLKQVYAASCHIVQFSNTRMIVCFSVPEADHTSACWVCDVDPPAANSPAHATTDQLHPCIATATATPTNMCILPVSAGDAGTMAPFSSCCLLA